MSTKQDWILFLSNGHTVVDVVIEDSAEEAYPRSSYAITPHYGKVMHSAIIERRTPTEGHDDE